MGISLNDIISRSEKKSKEQARSNLSQDSITTQKVDLNVLTLEAQQRHAKNISRLHSENTKTTCTPPRTYQVKTRLSEGEKQFFDKRVISSGLNQGDFMRQILLHESVEIRTVTAADAEALEILSGIASELGRIGGMIRGTVIRNKGEFGILSSNEKADLESQIRDLNRIKANLQKAVTMIYGNY